MLLEHVIHDVVVEKMYEILCSGFQLSGHIKMNDECLFGRAVKYNKGNCEVKQVWVFSMTEKSSGKIIALPVIDRTKDTLISLIKKYIKKGSTIYSDSRSAYQGLNDLEGFIL